MRKTLLLAAGLMFGFVSFSQENARMAPSGKATIKPIIEKTDLWSQDFEGDFPPTGWSVIDVCPNPDGNWHKQEDINNPTDHFAGVKYAEGDMINDWLITETIDLSTVVEGDEVASLKFLFFASYYWHVDPFDGADLFVKATTDDGATWTTLWVEEDYGIFENFAWNLVSISLNDYIGEANLKIGFHFVGDDGAHTGIDDVTVVVLGADEVCVPVAGTITLASETGASGDPVIITSVGHSEGVDYEYALEFRFNGGNWQTIEVADANVSIPVTGDEGDVVELRIVVKCVDSGESETSNTVIYTLGAADLTNCIPSGFMEDSYISGVSTTGATVNLDYSTTSYPFEGYDNQSALPFEAEAGSTFDMTVSYLDDWEDDYLMTVWVDWNQDDIFDPTTEMLYQSAYDYSPSKTFSFAVPTSTDAGAYKVRIAANWDEVEDPCGEVWYGSFLDLTLTVTSDDEGTEPEGCEGFAVAITGETEFCEGESTVLTLATEADDYTVVWSTEETTNEITVTEAGTYTVTISKDECEATSSVEVTVNSAPTVDAITYIQNDDYSYDFSATGVENASSYAWDFGDGNTSTEVAPSHSYEWEATFQVTLTVSNDCGEDSTTVEVIHLISGLSKEELAANFVLYPNPATNFVVFQNTTNIQSIVVVNSIGQNVFTNSVNANEFQLDVTTLTNGLYYANIVLENGNVIQRKFEVIN